MKTTLSLLGLSLLLLACGGKSPKEEEKDKEIEKLRDELKTELKVQGILGVYADFTTVDSLKLLIAVKEGREPQSKFDAFADSLAEVRLKESYVWEMGTSGNPIDGEWKYAYTETGYGSNFLQLVQKGSKVWFLFKGTYFCDDNPTVDMALKVNGKDQVYKIRGEQTRNSKGIIISQDFMNADFFSDFQNADSIYIRVNESHCDTEVINSSLAGVKEAIKHFDGI